MILIAGPCVIESEEHTLRMAYSLTELAAKHRLRFFFKASWDKANRSNYTSYRGVNIDLGVRILNRVKQECGCLVTSDVHESWQIEQMKDVLDLIQIPALLCRQTSLIVDAAGTGKPVNIKKGQFMAPGEMESAVRKADAVDCKEIMLTERGTTFGYGNLVVDMLSLVQMRDFLTPAESIIFDATHSCGGKRRFVKPLAKAAVAVGVDGLFIECHDKPHDALCDGQNMLTPLQLDGLLKEVC